MKDYLLAGSPPHWVQGLALLAYAILEWYLPRTNLVKANSVIEGIANSLKRALSKVPLVGWAVAQVASKETGISIPVHVSPPPSPPSELGQ